MRSGAQTPVKITYNSIRTLDQLAKKITTNIEIKPEDFLTALSDSLIMTLGFSRETIISMFIPNTYEVYWNTSAQELIYKMSKEYKKFWNDERVMSAQALGLSLQEISTLASIVQAEQMVHKAEHKTIAGLYINRLKRRYKLDSDPTLVFAIGDFSIRRVLNKHKTIKSPYNTYLYEGLPPGPICLPSIHAIDAVLHYEQHRYLYMCAKEDFSGYHNFAKTLVEHNKNASRYQRALNKAKLYR